MDILLLAAVAAFILYRLYRVLGQNVGLQKRPDLKTLSPTSPQATVIQDPDNIDIEPDEINAYLKIDPQFDLKTFLQGAKSAYEMILKAYVEADKALLARLLSAPLYKNFEASLSKREKKKEEVDNSLIRIKSCELMSIAADKKNTAVAKVKYVSEQIIVTYDEKGHVIEGDPDQIERITEIWTFKRDINSDDPNWKLYETESLD